MKKTNTKSVMTGLGVAMAIGSAATLIGSSMMSERTTMNGMKKTAEKAIKNFGNYLGNM